MFLEKITLFREKVKVTQTVGKTCKVFIVVESNEKMTYNRFFINIFPSI